MDTQLHRAMLRRVLYQEALGKLRATLELYEQGNKNFEEMEKVIHRLVTRVDDYGLME